MSDSPLRFAHGERRSCQIVACNDRLCNNFRIHTNSVVRFDNPDNFT
jgi:hypothetical protein